MCAWMKRVSVAFLLVVVGLSTPTVAFQPVKQRSALAGRAIFFSNGNPRAIDVASKTKLKASLLTSAVGAIDAFWLNSPYLAGAMACGVKASAADLVAQKRQNSLEATTPKTDVRRNLAFILYGSIYQGVGQEYIYNHLYPMMFGSGTAVVTVLSKVLFDLLLQTTLVTLPVAYLMKASIYRYSFGEAFRRYKYDILNQGLLTKYFALWGPIQCITFSIIPEHWRVTFIAFVSFFWLIILSTISSKADN